MKTRLTLALALTLGLSGAALAHDDDAMDHMDHMGQNGEHHHSHAFAFGHRGKAEEVTRTVAITMNDMSFTPDRLQVTVGETIRFRITNAGAVEHDFTLGDAATQAVHRQAMEKAGEEGHPHHHHHGGNAVMLAPGATGEVIWTFTKPGPLEFDCNVPGHFEAGMAGTLTVVP